MHKQIAIATLALLSYGALADDFFGAVETTHVTEQVTDSPWSRRAWLQQKVGFGYHRPAVNASRDRADLTRTETELYGEVDWRHDSWRVRLAGSLVHDWLPDLAQADVWQGYEFTPDQRYARRWRWEGSDSYLSWQQSDWWIKAGYQTLAWGESETQKVTDVLARRDQRWPGQEDLEELRLPVPALLVSWRNSLDFALLPQVPTDRQAAAFDEFDPYLRLRDRASSYSPQVVTHRGDAPGWALRWHSRQPGLDAQVMLADVYSFEATPISAAVSNAPHPHVQWLVLEPWRQQVLGLSVQAARGAWLLKTEQAWHRGTLLPQQHPLQQWRAHDQWRAAVVAEYRGINNLAITSEFSWRYTHNHTGELADPKWQTAQALRVGYRLFNDRLTLSGLTMRLLGGEGSLLRVTADWKWSDQLAIGASLVEYGATQPSQLLYDYRHNDAVLLTLRWGLF